MASIVYLETMYGLFLKDSWSTHRLDMARIPLGFWPTSKVSVGIPNTMVRTEGLCLPHQTIPYQDGNTMPIL